tara:strand:- start:2103 stop:2510 length:408 start_codon:yes stop_codon:yes gene_type:complete
MALSTAKAEATARDLKEVLEKRGFAVVESNVTESGKVVGRKLAIDADMSIQILAQSPTGKDIFGGDLHDFTPHRCLFASIDAATSQDIVKAIMSLGKFGFDLQVGSHATVLATAETAAADAEVERNSVAWPKKGA